MAKYAVVDVEQREAELTEVADAIREHTGDSEKMTIPEMAQNLRKLPGPIVATAVGNPIALSDATDLKLRGLKLFGRTTQDGTPTPEAPVPLVSAGDGGSVGVTVAGKNLLSTEIYKVTSVKGPYNSMAALTQEFTLLPGITYTLSCDTENTGELAYFNSAFCKTNKTIVMDGTRQSCTFVWETGKVCVATVAIVSRGGATSGTYSGLVSNIQLEVGSTATEYEPYTDQTAAFSTPNGLPGMKVTSGGTHTDETGQQWVCDEVDFGRGVYVQKVVKKIFDGSNDENIILSSTKEITQVFAVTMDEWTQRDDEFLSNISVSKLPDGDTEKIRLYGNVVYIAINKSRLSENSVNGFRKWLAASPVTILFPLKTPKEPTPLSAEEIAAYAALHTNYPNTTILNDGGAGMEVSYVADTKLYIDNKINAMAAAIVNA